MHKDLIQEIEFLKSVLFFLKQYKEFARNCEVYLHYYPFIYSCPKKAFQEIVLHSLPILPDLTPFHQLKTITLAQNRYLTNFWRQNHQQKCPRSLFNVSYNLNNRHQNFPLLKKNSTMLLSDFLWVLFFFYYCTKAELFQIATFNFGMHDLK